MAGRPQSSALEDHLGYWLRYVSNHVSQAFQARVEARGVTVAEWAVLRTLFDVGEANPSHIAEHMGLTRGAISKLVERLCIKALVTRTTVAGDRRYQSVTLTPQGRKLVPRLARLADENDHEFFGHLTPAAQAALIQTLQDIVQRQGWKEIPVS